MMLSVVIKPKTLHNFYSANSAFFDRFSQALLPTLWGSFCTYIYSEAPAYFNAFLWGSSADNCAFIGLDSMLSLRLFCRYHFLFRACFKALDCLSMQFLWGSCHAFDLALSFYCCSGEFPPPRGSGPGCPRKCSFLTRRRSISFFAVFWLIWPFQWLSGLILVLLDLRRWPRPHGLKGWVEKKNPAVMLSSRKCMQ